MNETTTTETETVDIYRDGRQIKAVYVKRDVVIFTAPNEFKAALVLRKLRATSNGLTSAWA